MSAEYEATVRLKANYPMDIDDDGQYIWWNETDVADEISSWLEDLGFDVQVTVRCLEEERE